eukprot:CAMPEP_0184711160 /NCGR_PEP_ID=MMETSP0314-20130426/1869_1 /TAXON_ID=38298 /ORGANISM="Rhodella maculata, Strain CCMP 736" /LENGTH=191 /DNA_ID=CAMNT_0027173203 /DNA_START=60 /DNA_END=636 /DNA_ORIENTATION=-
MSLSDGKQAQRLDRRIELISSNVCPFLPAPSFRLSILKLCTSTGEPGVDAAAAAPNFPPSPPSDPSKSPASVLTLLMTSSVGVLHLRITLRMWKNGTTRTKLRSSEKARRPRAAPRTGGGVLAVGEGIELFGGLWEEAGLRWRGAVQRCPVHVHEAAHVEERQGADKAAVLGEGASTAGDAEHGEGVLAVG